ncbi:hypothetical protein Tco_0982203 [Tanacetum coccineum]
MMTSRPRTRIPSRPPSGGVTPLIPSEQQCVHLQSLGEYMTLPFKDLFLSFQAVFHFESPSDIHIIVFGGGGELLEEELLAGSSKKHWVNVMLTEVGDLGISQIEDEEVSLVDGVMGCIREH